MKAPEKHEPQIFILDANPAILEYFRHILADRFGVSLFTRAEELIRSISQPNSAELVLIDWRTPDSDNEQGAHEVLSRIRLAKPSLPIVILACSLVQVFVCRSRQQLLGKVLCHAPFSIPKLEAKSLKAGRLWLGPFFPFC